MKYLLGSLAVLALSVGVGWAAGANGSVIAGIPSLALLAALAMAVQWVAWIPASALQSERFYDLTGSFTYLTVVVSGLTLATDLGPREWVLSAMVLLWSGRLGTFLFRRVHRDGKDGRFDEIKTRPPRFLWAWSLQGLWVFLTVLAVLTVLTGERNPPLGLFDAVGWALWGVGFALEVVADAQKSRFKADPANKGAWIEVGLWRWSRHPNYFGEILLWFGVFLSAATTFAGAQWIAVLSPLFVAFLLSKGSGVPLLEERADAKWGGDPAYEAYKERVPVLIPRPPRS